MEALLDAFDPYYKWLGIPPEEQPPNHYRLLGLRIFEQDSDVIESAAEKRMLLLRSRQAGAHAAACQRLLNEIAAAASCLLNHETRATYNVELRKGSDEQSIAPPPSAPGPIAAPTPAEFKPREPAPPPLPRAEPTAPPIAREEPPVDATAVNGKPAFDSAAQTEPPVDSWHIQTPDGAYWGPVSLAEVEGWAADGRISEGSYLLPAGSDQWIAATRLIAFPAAPDKYASSAGAPPIYGAPATDQVRCPNCQSADPPLISSSISAIGWVVFVLLIFLFCPLCFLGLLITEPRRVCRHCGHRFLS